MGYSLQIDLKSEIGNQSVLCKPRNLFLGRQRERFIREDVESRREFMWQVRIWCIIKGFCTGLGSNFQIRFMVLLPLGMIFPVLQADIIHKYLSSVKGKNL